MGDSADFMTDVNGAALEKYLSLPGGVRVTIRADGQYSAYPNLHGDVIALADGTGAKVSSTVSLTPLGPVGQLVERSWRMDGVVPVTVELVAGDREGVEVGVADLLAERVVALVQIGFDAQPVGG